MLKHKFYASFLLIFSISWSCLSKKVIPRPSAPIVKESKTNILAPSYTIYNPSVDSSFIFFKFDSENLQYKRKDQVSPYTANIQLSYQLFAYGNAKVVLKSDTILIKDEVRTKAIKTVTGILKLATEADKDYLIEIIANDLNRGASITQKIYIRKTNLTSEQYFLVVQDSNSTPVYTNYVSDTLLLKVISEVNRNKNIYLNYYNRESEIALPPFASVNTIAFDYKPDNRVRITLNEFGEGTFSMPTSGFLYMQSDSITKDGKTIFKFDTDYPKIKTVEGLINPLRYICSSAEYNALVNSENPKKSVDEFWLSKTSSKERARELIKYYYNRVEEANKYFSCHIEGWKTDRGMVSIIYGPPTVVRRSGSSETWVYGEENNLIALNFIFSQKENPFSENDYKLQRSSTYKTNWYRAVDTWRAGRVYFGN